MLRWAALGLLIFACPARGAEEWWNPAYPYRRALTVEVGQSEPEAAQVDVRFGGLCREDGKDIVLVGADMKPLPRHLTWLERTGVSHIAFDGAVPGGKYWVYFGGPPLNQDPWVPEAGVLLETRDKPEGPVDSWEQMKALLDTGSRPHGREWRKQIFDGFDPFEPELSYSRPFISICRGYFLAPAAGQYSFATASDDGSWLFVDGKLVAAWPGAHGVGEGMRGEFHGEVDLTEGKHLIEYYHVQLGGGTYAIAAWKPPSKDRYEVIPAEVFVPVLFAQAGPLERSSGLAADFAANQGLSVFLEDIQFTAVDFSVRASGPVEAEWSFGDGITATGSSTTHVFLGAGDYQVRVKATSPTDTFTYREQLRVKADFNAGWGKEEVERLYKIAGAYRLSDLEPTYAWALSRLAARAGDWRGEEADLVSFVRRAPPNDPRRYRALMLIGDARRHPDLGKPREALLAYLSAAKVAPDQATTLAARLAAADTRAEDLKDQVGGLAEYRKLLGDYALLKDRLPPVQRRIGDILLAQGKVEEARAAYREVAVLRGDQTTPLQQSVQSNSFRQSIEARIGRGDFAGALWELDRWEESLPWDKAEGLPPVLRGAVLMGMKRWREAAPHLELAMKIKPKSLVAGRAMTLLGECYARLGRRDVAESLLKQAASEYPGTPWALQAQQLLAHMPEADKSVENK